MNNYEIAVNTDSRQLVKALTDDYVIRSGRMYIRCPVHKEKTGHEDAHIGNCTVSQRGAYCYACGSAIKAADLARYYRPDENPYQVMADVMGLPYSNDSSRSSMSHEFYYDDQLLHELGYNGEKCTNPDQLIEVTRKLSRKLDRIAEQYGDITAPALDDLISLLGDAYDVSVITELRREIKRRKSALTDMENHAIAFLQYSR